MKRGSGALPKINRRLASGYLNEAQLLGMLRGTRKVRLFVSQLRGNLKTDQLAQISKIIARHPLFGSDALGAQFPRNVSQIRQRLPFEPIGLANEIVWASARLEIWATKIARFLELREELCREFLLGNDSKALDRISALENEIGYSLISIQIRLLALQNAKGRGAQKTFLRSVYNAEGVNAYVYYITYYLSLAAEHGGSIEKVNAALASFKTTTNSGKRVHSYLRMRLSRSLEFSDDELNDGLREAATFSTVDLYEALINVLQILLAAGRIQSLSPVALESISSLARQIPDFRLDVIRRLLNAESVFDARSSRYVAIMGQYVSGNLAASSDDAIQEVVSNPELSIYLPLIADSLNSITGLPSLPRKLVTGMSSILHCGETARSASKDLERLALIHSCFPWSRSVTAFINETSSYPRATQLDAHWVFAALNMPFLMPELIVGCLASPKNARFRMDEMAATCVAPMFAYLELLTCLDSEPTPAIGDQVDPAIRYTILAKRALRTGNLKEALDQGDVGTTLGFGRYLEVLSLHAMVLGRAQELELALRCLVEAYLDLPGCAVRFDVEKIIDDVDRRPSPIAHSNLDRPIGFDIFSKNIDGSKDRRLAFAYSQFLRAVGVSKPSDLRPMLNCFEKRRLLYFLRWICIPSVMDQFPGIDGTRALNQERISVCQIVAELEPSLESECFDEIKALTRKLVIYDGLKRVEQSKIYVDAESIRRSLEKRLAEQFARFSALVNSTQVFNEIAQIQERRLASQGGEPTESMSISLPTEDPASLFTSLVADIWREFLTGSEFSLDVYLSVRIRHGTLAGQLRSPLEALHLVTQHDGKRYNPNTHWTSGLVASDETVERLNAAFAEFSERVDDFIRRLSTSILRIRLQKEDDGVFDFRLGRGLINHMLARFDPSGTLSDLIILVFDTLWEILSKTLPALRSFFLLEVGSQFALHLEHLRENVGSLDIDACCPRLAPTIIEAEAVMQRTCARVANWFRLSKTSTSVDFGVDLAIAIAAESVRNCFGTNAIKENVGVSEALMLDGKYLLAFVDMFIILFENARRHSGINPCPVDVQVQRAGSLLMISVSNPLSVSLDRQRLLDRLQMLRSSWDDTVSAQVVAREGGSGFHKLRKILGGDLNCLNTFDFALRADRFVVDIVLEVVGWQ